VFISYYVLLVHRIIHISERLKSTLVFDTAEKKSTVVQMT